MRVPLEWLKEYVTVRLAPEALAEKLTMAGLEVTAIERVDGQPVFEIEVTPNRADCLSIIGVAREAAAITGQRLKLPLAEGSRLKAEGKSRVRKPPASSLQPRAALTIRIEDRKGCQRYIGRLIEGVTIDPSPDWMQQRLAACGTRPINNIVDITNYVLLEYGQPLHAFDFARLTEGTMLVRRAQPNEPMTTLDGVARKLPADTLVIADAKQAVAVAGIMGGMGSEVTGRTTTVLLESALFDPVTIRRTARRLGLASESSYRFERGVDPVGVESASARAASLISEVAGGRERTVVDAGTKPARRTVISLDPSRVARWLGTPVSEATLRTTLARLSCHVLSSGGGALRVTVPPFRRDLAQEADLYEEVARMLGYDRLPARVSSASATAASSEDTAQFWRIQSLKCVCASLGLTEAITWALVSESDLAGVSDVPARAVGLTNPLSQDHAYLRPSLLSGMLQAVRRNMTQGAAGVRLFEVGNVVPSGEQAEQLHVGIALCGLWSRDWQGQRACDVFRLKGLIDALVHRLCDGTVEWIRAQHPWAELGEDTELRLNDRTLGIAGRVARTITETLDLESDVWFAECSVNALIASRRATVTVSAPPVLPPVKRDLSVMVEETVACTTVEAVIREVVGARASRIELIDRYTGKSLPAGKYSLTFSIEYRDPARTLTAAETDVLHEQVRQQLVSRCAATLR